MFKIKKSVILFLVITISFLGCIPLQYKTGFNRIGEYQIKTKKKPIVKTPEEIKVYLNSSPDGFSLKENELKVEPGYKHKILGSLKVKYLNGSCSTGPNAGKPEVLITILKERAYKEGGNAIIYTYNHFPDDATQSDICRSISEKRQSRVITDFSFAGGWLVVLSK